MKHIFSMFAVFIALFLFGITVMRQGLFHLQGDKVKKFLYHSVNHPIKGVIVGTIVTAILQSSTAVTVIVVGLVSVGYLTFRNSIGIILGANIGTVITLEIIAFDLTWLIFPLFIVSVPLLFTNKQILFSIGCFLFGFSIIIISIDGFSMLAYPLSSITSVYNWLIATNEFRVLAVIVGVILSIIIQSSTAVTAIAMSFLNESVLTLPTSISIMLGANIGTCMTALLASFAGNKESRLAAFAHIWINVIGVIAFIPIINIFSKFIQYTASIPSLQLAHAALIFNVVSTLMILPFVDLFANFIQKVHGGNT